MPAARASTTPVPAAPLKLAFRVVDDERARILCDGHELKPVDRRVLLQIASRASSVNMDLPAGHPGAMLAFRAGAATVYGSGGLMLSRLGPDQVATKLMAAAPVHPQRDRIALAGYGLRTEGRFPVQLVDASLPLNERLRKAQRLALLGYRGPGWGFGELVLGPVDPSRTRVLARVPGRGLQVLVREGARWRRFVPTMTQWLKGQYPHLLDGQFEPLGWFRPLPNSVATKL